MNAFRNKRDGGRIPNFPEEKTLIICNEGDVVCDGVRSIEAPHLQYRQRAPEAAQFIFEHVDKRSQEGNSCPLR
jgi:cutinase